MSPERKHRIDGKQPATRRGAYGFRISGVHTDGSQLVGAPERWPALEISVRVRSAPLTDPEHIGDRTATLWLRSGGSVLVDRAAGRACFSLPVRPRAAALLHPHLAAAAVVAARWRGHDSYHAGAFVVDGGAWGVLGVKASGKSSTLALLAGMGLPVVCDDVLVLDEITALAGPRMIDLRADAARTLGVGEPLGVLGERERWRVGLAQVEPELPLRGWVALRWAQDTAVRPLRGSERLRELLCHRALCVPPPDPRAPVELSALPFLELSRPRRWESLRGSLGELLDAVARLT
jgi:hypothetical protein